MKREILEENYQTICPNCKTTDLERDAKVWYNKYTEDYEIIELLNTGKCYQCDTYINLIEVKL